MTVFSPQHLVWLGVTILFVAGRVGIGRCGFRCLAGCC